MVEYGIFNDEGCLEAGFYSNHDAAMALLERYSEEDEVTVSEVCPDHEEQRKDSCEECFGE